jgi:hypothetical protein
MSATLRALGAFLSAGLRPRSRLARAIVPVLLVKIGLVLLAKFTVFGGDHRIAVTPEMMEHRLAVPSRETQKES